MRRGTCCVSQARKARQRPAAVIRECEDCGLPYLQHTCPICRDISRAYLRQLYSRPHGVERSAKRRAPGYHPSTPLPEVAWATAGTHVAGRFKRRPRRGLDLISPSRFLRLHQDKALRPLGRSDRACGLAAGDPCGITPINFSARPPSNGRTPLAATAPQRRPA